MYKLNKYQTTTENEHLKYFNQNKTNFIGNLKSIVPLFSKESFIKKLILGTPRDLENIIYVLNKYDKKHRTFLYFYNKIKNKKTFLKQEKSFQKLAVKYFNNLCIRKKIDISNISKEPIDFNEYQKFIKNNIEKIKIGSIYSKMYHNYDTFIKVKEGKWDAYSLLSNSNVKVCPYCNRNYITLIKTNSGKSRAELDHFFPRSKYPYLSLSLYNLIPSCHICNSNLKKDKDFYKDKHLHPFTSNICDYFTFNYDTTNIDDINQIYLKDNILIKTTKKQDLDNTKVKNHINTFKIEEVYSNNIDTAYNILLKSKLYSKDRLKDLQKSFNDIFNISISPNYFKEIILDANIEESEINNKPLNKFIIDLSKDKITGLIQNLNNIEL